MQTEGLAGTQAQLCAVCHGEGRQQGHVHQKRRGQRAQQKSVGCTTTVALTLQGARCSRGEPLVLVFRRVVSVMEEVATDLGGSANQPGQMQKNVSKVKQKARACLQEMVASVSPAFIRYVALKMCLSSCSKREFSNKHCMLRHIFLQADRLDPPEAF